MISSPSPAPAPHPVVEAVGLHKSYRDGGRTVEVLAGVDLRLERGEMRAIVGPSGSGKSTLLHVVGALDRQEAGTLRVDGRELESLSRLELARYRNRTLGFVFQFHRLLPDFDALENVMMPGRIAGHRAAEVRDRARSLLVQVGLESRLDHFPSQLSGGERQRVAICRALALEPALLLADEPTGNLDPESAAQVFDLLLELQERHQTATLLVTHNPALARRCASISRLAGGRLTPLDDASMAPSRATSQPVRDRRVDDPESVEG